MQSLCKMQDSFSNFRCIHFIFPILYTQPRKERALKEKPNLTIFGIILQWHSITKYLKHYHKPYKIKKFISPYYHPSHRVTRKTQKPP